MSESDPARAFDDLRAEVSVLRRAVEALPDAWRENRPPDYSPDLGRLVSALGTVGRHLEAIEKNPTLKMTPESYRAGVTQAGMAAGKEMAGSFQKAIGEVQAERRQLAGIIGQARAQDRQSWWLLWCGLACLIVGLLVSPVVASLLPTGAGTRVASFIVGGKDRWESGSMMMQADSPEAWQNVQWDLQLIQENQPKIRDCRIEAEQKKGNVMCYLKINSQNN